MLLDNCYQLVVCIFMVLLQAVQNVLSSKNKQQLKNTAPKQLESSLFVLLFNPCNFSTSVKTKINLGLTMYVGKKRPRKQRFTLIGKMELRLFIIKKKLYSQKVQLSFPQYSIPFSTSTQVTNCGTCLWLWCET